MDVSVYLSDILLPFVLTMLFTYFIGMDRQRLGKPAGLKTHMLVAVGVCGISIFQQLLYTDMLDLVYADSDLTYVIKPENQRVIAQVVTGVGFLGAGAILKNKSGIEGLTTASTIWVVAMFSIIFAHKYFELGITLASFSVLWIKIGKLIH